MGIGTDSDCFLAFQGGTIKQGREMIDLPSLLERLGARQNRTRARQGESGIVTIVVIEGVRIVSRLWLNVIRRR